MRTLKPRPFVGIVMWLAMLALGICIIYIVVRGVLDGVIYYPTPGHGKGVHVSYTQKPNEFWFGIIVDSFLAIFIIYTSVRELISLFRQKQKINDDAA